MEEEKNITQHKKVRWSLASLIFGILLILALLLPTQAAVSIPLPGTIKKFFLNEGPLLTIIFGILGFKENKAFAIFGIVIGVVFILLQFLPLLAIILGVK